MKAVIRDNFIHGQRQTNNSSPRHARCIRRATRKQAEVMNGTLEFLSTYGYAALFGSVLAEQLGAPVPAAPVLLAAGALAGLGKLNLAVALLLAVGASLIGDTVWYYLGKTRGIAVLRLLCKISLEPDACVRKTNETYSKHGTRWLLFA